MTHNISNDRLSDLFRHNYNYQKHRDNLQQLHHRRSHNNSFNTEQTFEKYRARKQLNFIRRALHNQQKIIRQNSLIFNRLSNSTHSCLAKVSNSVDGRSPYQSIRKRSQDRTDKDNLKFYFKLTKLTPSINLKKFQKDYDKSVKIRDRISRFQKNPQNNTSINKLNRYFQTSVRSMPVYHKEQDTQNSANKQKLSSKPRRPYPASTHLTFFSPESNLNYKKEDIQRNKIDQKWAILKKKKFHSTIKNIKNEPRKDRQQNPKQERTIIATKETTLKNFLRNTDDPSSSEDRIFATEA